jgi:FkbM family methyltransferase
MKLLSTKIAPFKVFYHNGEEFHQLKGEVFTQGHYYFETTNPTPRIIDAGAHIGLSTLYFKKLYPGSEIIAIEPNPHVFRILEKNIEENQLRHVEALPVALSDQAGEEAFFMDESDEQWLSTASFTPGAWTGSQQSQETQVQTTFLSLFLDKPVDFLKMDIEGAEQKVLMAIPEHLHQIKHMIVEFHPVAGQDLEKLLEYLQNHRFSIQLWKNGKEVPNAKHAHGLVYIEAKQK